MALRPVVFFTTLRQELKCTPCPGNARMYDGSLLSVAHGVGRRYVPGLERAMDQAGCVYPTPVIVSHVGVVAPSFSFLLVCIRVVVLG